MADGVADEATIAAEEMVELEEYEDEGACYAFQVDEGQIVFVCGQDFYPSAKFPSSDFSIIGIVTQDGQLVDLLIEKRGKKLRPVRTIPGELRRRLRSPDHLEVIAGTLDKLEELLKEPDRENREHA